MKTIQARKTEVMRIIGTNLGQNTGKSNRELFLDNGYHIEKTTGDRVYEWFNPDYTHYVYKLSYGADYYIGVHSALKGVDDTYMGSGGVKFQNWKQSLIEHGQMFTKTIISTHATRAEAFKEEGRLIGDKYETDSHCKNSTSGGRVSAKRQHNGKGVKAGINDLASQQPDLVNEYDSERNYPLTPDNLHVGTPTKVWWTCSQGHHWQSEVRKRVLGYGCPICSGMVVNEGHNDLATCYPEIAHQLVPDQGIDAHNISKSSHKRALWQCDKGHVWEASVDTRTRGRGCPYCSGNRIIIGETDLFSVHPELKSWYDDEIDPETISPNSNKKVWWKCSKGHRFDMSPNTKQTQGCPICANKRVLIGYNDFKSQHPELMNEWSTKNTLDPESIISTSSKKALWICENGHEWEAAIRNRVRYNSKCPTCKGKAR